MIVDVVSSSVIYKGNQLNSTANTVIIDREPEPEPESEPEL